MLESLHAQAIVIEDLLSQEEKVLWEQPPVGPHFSHELEVQSFAHLLPGYPLSYHKGHTVLRERRREAIIISVPQETFILPTSPTCPSWYCPPNWLTNMVLSQ